MSNLAVSVRERLSFPRGLVSLALIAGLWGACHSSLEPRGSINETERPNIIFIVADDLGYQDLGVYGSPSIKTPNLDRLAAEGRRFTQSYSNGSVCSPTRSALHTGRYPQRWGFRDGIKPGSSRGLPTSVGSLPEMLRRVGYSTSHIGKWHLGHSDVSYAPLAQGYGRFFGFLHAWQLPKTYTNPVLRTGAESGHRYEGHLTDILTDRAIDWIRDGSPQRPQFLSLWYFAPHKPIEPPKRWARLYPDSEWGRYGALVSTLDENIGRLLKVIEEQGDAANTIVVFASDNGGVASLHGGRNGPFRGGKNQLFEGGIRVPLIVRWPGHVTAGTVEEEVVLSHDWLPTFAQVVGETTPSSKTDGRIVGSLLSNDGVSEPMSTIYWERSGPDGLHFAVRKDSWKLLGHGEKRLLFNLESDGEESMNLAADHPLLVEDLESSYWRWRRQSTLVADLQVTGESSPRWTFPDDPRLNPHDGELTIAGTVCRGQGEGQNVATLSKGADWGLTWKQGLVEVWMGPRTHEVSFSLEVGQCSNWAFAMAHPGSIDGSRPGRLQLWIDGVLLLSDSTSGPVAVNEEPLVFEPLVGTPKTEFAWSNVAIWSTLLEPVEIRDLSNTHDPTL